MKSSQVKYSFVFKGDLKNDSHSCVRFSVQISKGLIYNPDSSMPILVQVVRSRSRFGKLVGSFPKSLHSVHSTQYQIIPLSLICEENLIIFGIAVFPIIECLLLMYLKPGKNETFRTG